MPRFFIRPEEIKKGVARLDKDESHHAVSVLRTKAGDTVELFDGGGKSFSGVVIGLEGGRLSVMLNRNAERSGAPPAQITLAASVIKPDRMDLLIQKSCELGASSIAPLLTERSIVKISKERWESKVKRWQKIALESCKQCGRDTMPQVLPAQPFKVFCESLIATDLILIPTLVRKGARLYDVLKRSTPEKILVFIGPEGDFTDKEVDLAVSRGAVPVSLGALVMRSETAALYVLAALNFYLREIQ